MFNCQKMHHKCKAECCSVCPIPKDIWERNQSKIVRTPIEVIDCGLQPDPSDFKNKHFVQPITKDMMCPFLNVDYSCNIYEDRPGVCRDFGNETHPDLCCAFQDKNGRIRSRQETRKLHRECLKRTLVLSKIEDKLRIIND